MFGLFGDGDRNLLLFLFVDHVSPVWAFTLCILAALSKVWNELAGCETQPQGRRQDKTGPAALKENPLTTAVIKRVQENRPVRGGCFGLLMVPVRRCGFKAFLGSVCKTTTPLAFTR